MSTCTTFNPHESTGGSGVVPPGVPGHPLIATLAREQAIEGNVGTCEVKWATGWPATSKVYISVISNTGPWTTVVNSAALSFEHSFTFSALGNQQHWYYVESVSDVAGLESSSVQTFDADANPHALNVVMGKERSCEGEAGTAWVNWATGRPGTSKIYASLASDVGPWTTVIDNATETTTHDFTFPILGIDSKHWFYVESLSDGEGLETSAVFVFCTGGEVFIVSQGLAITPSISIIPSTTLPFDVSLFTTAPGIDTESDSSLISPLVTGFDFTILTEVSLDATVSTISTLVTVGP